MARRWLTPRNENRIGQTLKTRRARRLHLGAGERARAGGTARATNHRALGCLRPGGGYWKRRGKAQSVSKGIHRAQYAHQFVVGTADRQARPAGVEAKLDEIGKTGTRTPA